MLIRCIIVDDEPPAVDELRYILSGIEDVEVVAAAGSASAAIAAARELKPDVIFLDIQMPERSGFHVAEQVADLSPPPFIVFATAYDQYAVRAFDQGAVDYILKPFSENRVRKSLHRVREMIRSRDGGVDAGRLKDLLELIREREDPLTRLPAEKQGHIILLKPADIVYCKAEERRVLIFAHDETFIRHAPSSLDELEEKLQHFAFLRTHRSFLVNPAYVNEIIPWFHGRYVLKMADSAATEIPVSRRRAKTVRQQLGLHHLP